jgi:hypothetical protein
MLCGPTVLRRLADADWQGRLGAAQRAELQTVAQLSQQLCGTPPGTVPQLPGVAASALPAASGEPAPAAGGRPLRSTSHGTISDSLSLCHSGVHWQVAGPGLRRMVGSINPSRRPAPRFRHLSAGVSRTGRGTC